MNEMAPRPAVDATDRAILRATQAGLPLDPRPYDRVAETVGVSADEVMARIAARAAEASAEAPAGCGIEIETLNSYPGLDTPPDAEVVSFVKALTGANSTSKVAFGTEGGLFSERLGVPTVVCGPGSMAQGHKPDEFIARAQIEACDAMLDRLVERLSA